MDLLQAIEGTRFIGEEFLLWLWFRSERQDGIFKLADGTDLELYYDDRLTLEAPASEAQQNSISGGTPSDSPEAREALRQGKRVTKVKLRLVRAGREWVTTITAATLGLSGVKMPAVLSKEDDDQFYERMYLIEELEGLLRELYKTFLTTRLNREVWRLEAVLMRAWVAQPAPVTGRAA